MQIPMIRNLVLFLVAAIFVNCASRRDYENKEAKAPAEVTVVKEASTSSQSVSPPQETQTDHNQGHDKFHRTPGPIKAEQALLYLQNGNKRYLTGRLRKDGQSKRDISTLAKGQKPHSIILSCSDSRVPPEVVFDEKLGEIFVVRTAGETLAAPVIGSIEYALEHLGSNLIVVMGHTSCGAVKAAHGTLDGSKLGSPWLDTLVSDIHPRIRSLASQTPSKNFVDESWANVAGVAADLMARSDIIRAAVASGEVKITQAMYDLENGQVSWR